MYYADIILGYCETITCPTKFCSNGHLFQEDYQTTSSRDLYPATFFFAIINTRDPISMSDEKLHVNIHFSLLLIRNQKEKRDYSRSSSSFLQTLLSSHP